MAQVLPNGTRIRLDNVSLTTYNYQTGGGYNTYGGTPQTAMQMTGMTLEGTISQAEVSIGVSVEHRVQYLETQMWDLQTNLKKSSDKLAPDEKLTLEDEVEELKARCNDLERIVKAFLQEQE
jgi:hypothetical protein